MTEERNQINGAPSRDRVMTELYGDQYEKTLIDQNINFADEERGKVCRVNIRKFSLLIVVVPLILTFVFEPFIEWFTLLSNWAMLFSLAFTFMVVVFANNPKL